MLYLEVDISQQQLLTTADLELDGSTFDVEYGNLIFEFATFDEQFEMNGVEFGLPDSYKEIEVDDYEIKNLKIESWEYDNATKTAKIKCSYEMIMEDGNSILGEYDGEIDIVEN